MLEVKSTGEDNWKEMEGGESEREAASEARRLREIGGTRGMRARVFQATERVGSMDDDERKLRRKA